MKPKVKIGFRNPGRNRVIPRGAIDFHAAVNDASMRTARSKNLMGVNLLELQLYFFMPEAEIRPYFPINYLTFVKANERLFLFLRGSW